jgi:hypothetical protein
MAFKRHVLLLAASTAVGLGLFEIGVRVAGIDYNLSPNWKFHPVLGWSQVPNGRYEVVSQGHQLRVQFNSMGFRDREHERAKPPGVKRIVVIGDSFSEAVQVNVEDTFHRKLEELLNQSGPARWEVINLGVGDFGTAQEYIALMEYGLAYQPDVVVHQIFPLNDICNNSIALYELCRSHNDRYRPYFVESDGQLRQVYEQPVRTWLRRHSVSYNALEYWLLKLDGVDPQSPEDRRRPGRLLKRGFTGLDPLLYTYVSAGEQPEAVAQGWRITERLIEQIVEVTRARGISYVGLVAPFEMTLQPAWEDFARTQPPPLMTPAYPERRLAAEFARLGVHSVMLLDAFQPYLKEVLPFIGGHFSAAGHRRAAEALYRELVRSGVTGR